MNLYLLLEKTDLIKKKGKKKKVIFKKMIFAMTMQENVKSIGEKKKNQLREKVCFNAHCILLAENPQI